MSTPTRITAPPAEILGNTERFGYFQVLHGAYPALTSETASGDAGSGVTPAPAASCAESPDSVVCAHPPLVVAKDSGGPPPVSPATDGLPSSPTTATEGRA
jgi:hypothetical protein